MQQWPIEEVSFSLVKPCAEMARETKKKQAQNLNNSISQWGYTDLIVWNKQTGHIVKGVEEFEILKSRGVSSCKMVVVEFDESRERLARLSLYNQHSQGEFTEDAINLLEELDQTIKPVASSVGLSSLKQKLEKKFRKKNKEEVADVSMDGVPDTECPCCKHKFVVEAKDVTDWPENESN